ncbi:STAS domain-containing protein [Streptomyces sp. NPDC058662]|uniref:STAS domain-containing protein n=1 Tax=Streptomyces sp. NPDC058662 TaxID=3346583 RepID=UPI00365EB30F
MASVDRPDSSASPVGPRPGPADGAGADAVAPCADTRAAGTTALTVMPLPDLPGARLSGSCDLDTRHVLSAALGTVTGIPGPVVHLDLSAVLFLDPAAVAALVQAAADLNGQGRRLLLHDPPYSLRKVVEMFPDECAALEVAA